jgi:hypothetical protein
LPGVFAPAGWREALPMMQAGSKWQIFVPTELAYGQESFGRIPPNSALIFEIELLAIGMPDTPRRTARRRPRCLRLRPPGVDLGCGSHPAVL